MFGKHIVALPFGELLMLVHSYFRSFLYGLYDYLLTFDEVYYFDFINKDFSLQHLHDLESYKNLFLIH